MATHSTILAWRIPGLREPGGLPIDSILDAAMVHYHTKNDLQPTLESSVFEERNPGENTFVDNRIPVTESSPESEKTVPEGEETPVAHVFQLTDRDSSQAPYAPRMNIPETPVFGGDWPETVLGVYDNTYILCSGKEGLIRPETFDSQRFQFYCGKAKGSGRFCPKVRSVSKRVRPKINRIGEWIMINRHSGLKYIFRLDNSALRCYFNYHSVTYNSKCVNLFRYEVIRLLFKWLNRRSQRRSCSWVRFIQMMRDRLVDAHIRVNIYTCRTKRLTD